MANFTQTNPVQYKDYVAVNPVEAMTAVGLQREQQLQEGIRTVNDYYSKVAGIDVVRDVDKNYISSSLTNIKSGVAKTLSGDFSDSRIVNQITGAAKKIFKDPVVQRAAISTAQARKGQAEMDEARKRGENAPANDALFNKNLMKYVQSTDQESSFNYNYEKYTDVNKQTTDIISKLHSSGTLTDEAFENVYDAQGNITGRRLSESTIRNGFEGVKPEQIRAALRAGLSPQAWRQLEIDGVYQYSNVPDQEFVKLTQESYAQSAQAIQQKLKYLDGTSTTSGAEKAAIEDKRQNLLKELDHIKNEYDGITSTFASGNIEAGKAKLHTLRTISNLANANSYGKLTSIYQGDTPQQAERWRQENAQKLAQWQLKFNQDAQFHSENLAEKKRENALKAKEIEATWGSTGTILDKDVIPDVSMGKFLETTGAIKTEMDGGRDQFIAKNNLDPNSHEGRAFYAQKRAAYENTPNSLTPIERNFFRRQEAKESEYDANLAVGTQIQQEADQKFRNVRDLIPKGAQPIVVATAQGQVRVDPEDFVNFNERSKEFIKTSNSGIGGGSMFGGGSGFGEERIIYDFVGAKKSLPKSQYLLFEALAAKDRTPAQQQLISQASQYNLTVNAAFKEEIKKKEEFVNNKIREKVLVNTGTLTNMPIVNPTTKNQADALLAELATVADQYNGKIGDATSEDLRAAIGNDKRAFTFERSEPTRFQEARNIIVVSTDKGTFRVPITEQQRQNKFGNEFAATPDQQAFKPIADQIQKQGGTSTKLGVTPFLGQGKFPSVKNYSIKGDVEKDPESGEYSMYLTLRDPVTGKIVKDVVYPKEGTIQEKDVIDIMRGLDDAAVFQLIHNQKPTQADLKALEAAGSKSN